MNSEKTLQKCVSFATLLLITLCAGMLKAQTVQEITPTPNCERTIKADVVAFDQPFFYNRLGAVNPAGMIYALRRDVKPKNSTTALAPGNVMLKDYKRARPIVLRMNVGDCLQILFQTCSILNARTPTNQRRAPPASTQSASSSETASSTTAPTLPQTRVVSSLPTTASPTRFTPKKKGNFLMYSSAATTGGEGDGGSLPMGLFGSINVEARGAEWYRSQVTEKDLALATKKNADGTPMTTPGKQPIIDYDAVYPANSTRPAGTPILKMLDANNNIVHTDLNAIITGPGRGNFPAGTYRPSPIAISRSVNSQWSITTRSKLCRRFRNSTTRSTVSQTRSPSRCTVFATASRSTTAPAASAPRFLVIDSASGPWGYHARRRHDLPRLRDDVSERRESSFQRHERRSDQRSWYRRAEPCRGRRSGRLGTGCGELSNRAALETHGLRS
jgi:hypothetical protein